MSDNLFFLSRESMQAIEDDVFDFLANLEDALVESAINSKGLAYGDIELPPAEALMKFAGDEQSGVNAWIAQNEPKEYEQRTREFVTNVQRSGLV